MNQKEIIQIIIAILTLTIVVGFRQIISLNFNYLGFLLLFSSIIILVNILAKKIIARNLDADVEHEIWKWSRYGFRPSHHLDSQIPIGIILPLFITIFSLGAINLTTLLTYETHALKRRAAKRFGPYSFTEMTDFHNALVGAAGIISVLIVAIVGYWFQPIAEISKIAAFYAFFNMIPISKLDGSQIFFGSRVLWSILAVITMIFTAYALLLI